MSPASIATIQAGLIIASSLCMLAAAALAWAELVRKSFAADPLIPIEPDARVGKIPCGECHLQPGDTCDICGAGQ